MAMAEISNERSELSGVRNNATQAEWQKLGGLKYE